MTSRIKSKEDTIFLNLAASQAGSMSVDRMVLACGMTALELSATLKDDPHVTQEGATVKFRDPQGAAMHYMEHYEGEGKRLLVTLLGIPGLLHIHPEVEGSNLPKMSFEHFSARGRQRTEAAGIEELSEKLQAQGKSLHEVSMTTELGNKLFESFDALASARGYKRQAFNGAIVEDAIFEALSGGGERPTEETALEGTGGNTIVVELTEGVKRQLELRASEEGVQPEELAADLISWQVEE